MVDESRLREIYAVIASDAPPVSYLTNLGDPTTSIDAFRSSQAIALLEGFIQDYGISNINIQPHWSSGDTFLMHACKHHNILVALWLMCHGADAELQDWAHEMTPLAYVCHAISLTEFVDDHDMVDWAWGCLPGQICRPEFTIEPPSTYEPPVSIPAQYDDDDDDIMDDSREDIDDSDDQDVEDEDIGDADTDNEHNSIDDQHSEGDTSSDDSIHCSEYPPQREDLSRLSSPLVASLQHGQHTLLLLALLLRWFNASLFPTYKDSSYNYGHISDYFSPFTSLLSSPFPFTYTYLEVVKLLIFSKHEHQLWYLWPLISSFLRAFPQFSSKFLSQDASFTTGNTRTADHVHESSTSTSTSRERDGVGGILDLLVSPPQHIPVTTGDIQAQVAALYSQLSALYMEQYIEILTNNHLFHFPSMTLGHLNQLQQHNEVCFPTVVSCFDTKGHLSQLAPLLGRTQYLSIGQQSDPCHSNENDDDQQPSLDIPYSTSIHCFFQLFDWLIVDDHIPSLFSRDEFDVAQALPQCFSFVYYMDYYYGHLHYSTTISAQAISSYCQKCPRLTYDVVFIVDFYIRWLMLRDLTNNDQQDPVEKLLLSVMDAEDTTDTVNTSLKNGSDGHYTPIINQSTIPSVDIFFLHFISNNTYDLDASRNFIFILHYYSSNPLTSVVKEVLRCRNLSPLVVHYILYQYQFTDYISALSNASDDLHLLVSPDCTRDGDAYSNTANQRTTTSHSSVLQLHPIDLVPLQSPSSLAQAKSEDATYADTDLWRWNHIFSQKKLSLRDIWPPNAGAPLQHTSSSFHLSKLCPSDKSAVTQQAPQQQSLTIVWDALGSTQSQLYGLRSMHSQSTIGISPDAPRRFQSQSNVGRKFYIQPEWILHTIDHCTHYVDAILCEVWGSYTTSALLNIEVEMMYASRSSRSSSSSSTSLENNSDQDQSTPQFITFEGNLASAFLPVPSTMANIYRLIFRYMTYSSEFTFHFRLYYGLLQRYALHTHLLLLYSQLALPHLVRQYIASETALFGPFGGDLVLDCDLVLPIILSVLDFPSSPPVDVDMDEDDSCEPSIGDFPQYAQPIQLLLSELHYTPKQLAYLCCFATETTTYAEFKRDNPAQYDKMFPPVWQQSGEFQRTMMRGIIHRFMTVSRDAFLHLVDLQIPFEGYFDTPYTPVLSLLLFCDILTMQYFNDSQPSNEVENTYKSPQQDTTTVSIVSSSSQLEMDLAYLATAFNSPLYNDYNSYMCPVTTDQGPSHASHASALSSSSSSLLSCPPTSQQSCQSPTCAFAHLHTNQQTNVLLKYFPCLCPFFASVSFSSAMHSASQASHSIPSASPSPTMSTVVKMIPPVHLTARHTREETPPRHNDTQREPWAALTAANPSQSTLTHFSLVNPAGTIIFDVNPDAIFLSSSSSLYRCSHAPLRAPDAAENSCLPGELNANDVGHERQRQTQSTGISPSPPHTFFDTSSPLELEIEVDIETHAIPGIVHQSQVRSENIKHILSRWASIVTRIDGHHTHEFSAAAADEQDSETDGIDRTPGAVTTMKHWHDAHAWTITDTYQSIMPRFIFHYGFHSLHAIELYHYLCSYGLTVYNCLRRSNVYDERLQNQAVTTIMSISSPVALQGSSTPSPSSSIFPFFDDEKYHHPVELLELLCSRVQAPFPAASYNAWFILQELLTAIHRVQFLMNNHGKTDGQSLQFHAQDLYNPKASVNHQLMRHVSHHTFNQASIPPQGMSSIDRPTNSLDDDDVDMPPSQCLADTIIQPTSRGPICWVGHVSTLTLLIEFCITSLACNDFRFLRYPRPFCLSRLRFFGLALLRLALQQLDSYIEQSAVVEQFFQQISSNPPQTLPPPQLSFTLTPLFTERPTGHYFGDIIAMTIYELFFVRQDFCVLTPHRTSGYGSRHHLYVRIITGIRDQTTTPNMDALEDGRLLKTYDSMLRVGDAGNAPTTEHPWISLLVELHLQVLNYDNKLLRFASHLYQLFRMLVVCSVLERQNAQLHASSMSQLHPEEESRDEFSSAGSTPITGPVSSAATGISPFEKALSVFTFHGAMPLVRRQDTMNQKPLCFPSTLCPHRTRTDSASHPSSPAPECISLDLASLLQMNFRIGGGASDCGQYSVNDHYPRLNLHDMLTSIPATRYMFLLVTMLLHFDMMEFSWFKVAGIRALDNYFEGNACISLASTLNSNTFSYWTYSIVKVCLLYGFPTTPQPYGGGRGGDTSDTISRPGIALSRGPSSPLYHPHHAQSQRSHQRSGLTTTPALPIPMTSSPAFSQRTLSPQPHAQQSFSFVNIPPLSRNNTVTMGGAYSPQFNGNSTHQHQYPSQSQTMHGISPFPIRQSRSLLTPNRVGTGYNTPPMIGYNQQQQHQHLSMLPLVHSGQFPSEIYQQFSDDDNISYTDTENYSDDIDDDVSDGTGSPQIWPRLTLPHTPVRPSSRQLHTTDINTAEETHEFSTMSHRDPLPPSAMGQFTTPTRPAIHTGIFAAHGMIQDTSSFRSPGLVMSFPPEDAFSQSHAHHSRSTYPQSIVMGTRDPELIESSWVFTLLNRLDQLNIFSFSTVVLILRHHFLTLFGVDPLNQHPGFTALFERSLEGLPPTLWPEWDLHSLFDDDLQPVHLYDDSLPSYQQHHSSWCPLIHRGFSIPIVNGMTKPLPLPTDQIEDHHDQIHHHHIHTSLLTPGMLSRLSLRWLVQTVNNALESNSTFQNANGGNGGVNTMVSAVPAVLSPFTSSPVLDMFDVLPLVVNAQPTSTSAMASSASSPELTSIHSLMDMPPAPTPPPSSPSSTRALLLQLRPWPRGVSHSDFKKIEYSFRPTKTTSSVSHHYVRISLPGIWRLVFHTHPRFLKSKYNRSIMASLQPLYIYYNKNISTTGMLNSPIDVDLPISPPYDAFYDIFTQIHTDLSLSGMRHIPSPTSAIPWGTDNSSSLVPSNGDVHDLQGNTASDGDSNDDDGDFNDPCFVPLTTSADGLPQNHNYMQSRLYNCITSPNLLTWLKRFASTTAPCQATPFSHLVMASHGVEPLALLMDVLLVQSPSAILFFSSPSVNLWSLFVGDDIGSIQVISPSILRLFLSLLRLGMSTRITSPQPWVGVPRGDDAKGSSHVAVPDTLPAQMRGMLITPLDSPSKSHNYHTQGSTTHLNDYGYDNDHPSPPLTKRSRGSPVTVLHDDPVVSLYAHDYRSQPQSQPHEMSPTHPTEEDQSSPMWRPLPLHDTLLWHQFISLRLPLISSPALLEMIQFYANFDRHALLFHPAVQSGVPAMAQAPSILMYNIYPSVVYAFACHPYRVVRQMLFGMTDFTPAQLEAFRSWSLTDLMAWRESMLARQQDKRAIQAYKQQHDASNGYSAASPSSHHLSSRGFFSPATDTTHNESIVHSGEHEHPPLALALPHMDVTIDELVFLPLSWRLLNSLPNVVVDYQHMNGSTPAGHFDHIYAHMSSQAPVDLPSTDLLDAIQGGTYTPQCGAEWQHAPGDDHPLSTVHLSSVLPVDGTYGLLWYVLNNVQRPLIDDITTLLLFLEELDDADVAGDDGLQQHSYENHQPLYADDGQITEGNDGYNDANSNDHDDNDDMSTAFFDEFFDSADATPANPHESRNIDTTGGHDLPIAINHDKKYLQKGGGVNQFQQSPLMLAILRGLGSNALLFLINYLGIENVLHHRDIYGFTVYNYLQYCRSIDGYGSDIFTLVSNALDQSKA